MSSQPAFEASSPVSPSTARRKKSRFTYKHLNQLSLYSTTCPLRVIALIDLDAFYAQCEMVRLGVPSDQPLAVQQWQGLIAINYAARAFGLSRHVTCAEAKKACPSIILQHVATWKEGDDKWAYREDAAAHIATHKVSLDPYRAQSRLIFATVREALPAKLQRVEKASIDELFLDLSAHVHSILLERYPILQGPAPYDDPTELLPRPPTTAIDWTTDALVDLDSSQTEDDDPDWDDIAMSIASEIVRDVRAQVLSKLHYTCSAGIARNKMLAKLGAGHKKPNQQTIVRNRAVQAFLSGFKFTKIRNLGGKLGDEVVAAFNTDSVTELLTVPVEQLKQRLGDDTGSWLWNTIRGDEHSEVTSRTAIKSMLSAKSFRPAINDIQAARRWLRIFVADLYNRLDDEGALDAKGRRPRTLNLHHRQGGKMRSKQAPIPGGKPVDENMLFEVACTLMAQVIVDGGAWPCANLSLSVGGFDEPVADNLGIGGFLVRGEEARALKEAAGLGEDVALQQQPPAKKRKTEPEGIRTFFGGRAAAKESTPTPVMEEDSRASETEGTVCEKCGANVPLGEEAEHADWHFAADLQAESDAAQRQQQQERPKPPQQQQRGQQVGQVGRGRGGKTATAPGRTERGQQRLAFGR